MLGVLPRTLRYMFSEIQSREAQENVHYSCFVSFMEIYNERIKDLLNPGNEKKLNILLILYTQSFIPLIREVSSPTDHRIAVENLTIVSVSSAAEANQIVLQGLHNRRVGVTNMNSRSSRSHAIFTLYMTCEVMLISFLYCRRYKSPSLSHANLNFISSTSPAVSDKRFPVQMATLSRRPATSTPPSLPSAM